MPLEENDLVDAIEENALKPKRVRGDSGEAEQHSLKEQIEADRYVRSKRASLTGLGIKFVKLVPPDSE